MSLSPRPQASAPPQAYPKAQRVSAISGTRYHPSETVSSCIKCNLYTPGVLKLLGRINHRILDTGIHHNTARLRKCTYLRPAEAPRGRSSRKKLLPPESGKLWPASCTSEAGEERQALHRSESLESSPCLKPLVSKVIADSTLASPKFGQ